jgi:4'-phosphopantetheinyl transferase
MISIRVYHADLGLLSEKACFALLDETEKSRAAGVSNRSARQEFVRSRALLRLLLSKHTGLPAGTLAFATGENGKPVLLGSSGIHFNVSHSDGTALIAIASAEIGVDIERIDGSVDYAGVAQSVFSRPEIEMLRKVSDARRGEVFFSIWTRKEAYLKATGAGFSSNLPMISTAALDGTIEDHGDSAGRSAWHVFDLPVGGYFKAALVMAARECRIDFVDVDDMVELPVHKAPPVGADGACAFSVG